MSVQDFVVYFKNRYSWYKNLLINRPELNGAVSIAKLQQGDKATLIATIADIKQLPSGTTKLLLEDLSGQTSAIISVKSPELATKAKTLCFDEVLAFKGTVGKGIFFIDEIAWPDIPPKKPTLTPDEVYVAFCGDLHVGSNMWLPKQWAKFTDWLEGKRGNRVQREIDKKTKYVIILGDVVDGIGIHPSQEKELAITDIYKQYDAAAQTLTQIPSDRHVLIIPGNHDGPRICEPQQALYKDLAAPLYSLPNTQLLSNPCYTNTTTVLALRFYFTMALFI